MRYLFTLISFVLVFPLLTTAQNRVYNGSFETYSPCPTQTDQVNRCSGWRKYTGGTSDYFHACGSMVPVNTLGYQPAADGNAYMGMVIYQPGNTYKEYIAGVMSPLQAGKAYEVSMSVSLSNDSKFSVDDIGIFFYDSWPNTQPGISGELNVTPQVTFANYFPITDTQKWVRVTMNYVADSAYDNLIIGGFKSNSNIKTHQLSYGNSWCYIFVDSVTVTLLDSFRMSYQDSILCAKDTFNVSYTTMAKYKSNNVFTAQLSDKNGNFGSPIDIGTVNADTTGMIKCTIPANIANGSGYKIRVASSSPADVTKAGDITIDIANPDSSSVAFNNNSPICEQNALIFSGSTAYSTTYTWTGPNSYYATGAGPSIVNAKPTHSGDYYVTAKFNNCVVKDTLPVTVKPVPANVIAGSNGTICEGDTVQLTSSTTTAGVSYNWSGPNSFSSTTQNPVIPNGNPSHTGTYLVMMSLNGCTGADTTQVLVNTAPKNLVTGNNAPICDGDTLKLSVTNSTNGITYYWTGPDNFTSTQQKPAIDNASTNAAGWYKVTLSVNGCSKTDSTQAVIHSIPPPPTVGSIGTLCAGEQLKLSAGTVAGATYKWTGPNSFSSTAQNPAKNNIQPADAGTYSVTATVNGCPSPAATVNVSINPTPFVAIYPSPSDSICLGDPVVFTALPNNIGGTPQYKWFVNGQHVSTGMIYANSLLKDGDIIRCDMTEYTQCSIPYTDPSNDVQMNVLPWLAPSVTITADKNGPVKEGEYIIFTANAVNAGPKPQYQWKRNGQDILGARGQTWAANTLNNADSISVELVSSYKCPQPATASAEGIVVNILVSVNDIGTVNNLQLYPNPNNGSFVLTGKVAPGVKFDMEVVNAVGQVIYKDDVLPAGRELNKKIEITGIAPGLYLLKLNNGSGSSYMRFVVR